MREVQRLVPSVTVGEYRAGAERPEDGGLYPLAEAGTYGQVPRAKHPGKWAQPKAEKKPKTYASYNICQCCAGKTQDWAGDREPASRRGSPAPPPPQRAASEPPQMKKKVVKFVKRSESEPVRSSVEEELGMMGRLRLAREVQADARDSLKGV